MKVLFIGSKNIGLRALRTLHDVLPDGVAGAVTIDDSLDSRTAYQQLTAECSASGIPLVTLARGESLAETLDRFTPDLCLVAGWYRLVAPELLARVRHGFIGIHFSALPRYRGGSPVVWALINGEPEIGLSLFSFAAGMDDGDIWGQRILPAGPREHVGEVLARLEDAAITLLAEKLPAIVDGSATPCPQEHTGASYCVQRTRRDGEIDWRWPARRLHDFVRAQSEPYPGAFTYARGEPLTIWRARLEDTPCYGAPGQVARVTPEGVYVVCGDSRPLVVEVVQSAGDERLPAAAALRSISQRLGEPAVRPA